MIFNDRLTTSVPICCISSRTLGVQFVAEVEVRLKNFEVLALDVIDPHFSLDFPAQLLQQILATFVAVE